MRKYCLEELVPFGGDRENQQSNLVELVCLRLVAAAARRMVNAAPVLSDELLRDEVINVLGASLVFLDEAQR